jgi:hypothetical protein
MSRQDLAFGVWCVGVGAFLSGLVGLFFGLLGGSRWLGEPGGFDPYGLRFWRGHRRLAWALVFGGLAVAIVVAPFLG